METALVVAYTFLFLFLIRKLSFFRLSGISETFTSILFIIKIIAGMILGWIYTYYYTDHGTSDSLKFFNDSGILFDSLKTNFHDFIRMFTGIDGNAPELRSYYVKMDTWLNIDVLFNDNKTIIRVNTLFRFFSLGYYAVHVVFINFLALIGFVSLLKIFLHYCPEKKKTVAIFSLLLPSVLFWGSGLLKDTLLIFAFGVLCYTCFKIVNLGWNRKRITSFLLFTMALMFIKLYVLVIIFPGILIWVFTRNMSMKRTAMVFLIGYVLYFTAAFNFHRVNEKFDVADIIYWKQTNFYTQASTNKARSVIEIPKLEPTNFSLIKNSPAAFFITLLRPALMDSHGNSLIFLSALENLFILIMLISGIWCFKRRPIDGFILFCIIYLFLLFALIGLITPVLGALVRYKVPGLPVLMFLIIYFADFDKLPFLRALKKERFNPSLT